MSDSVTTAYATAEDVALRLGRALTTAETARVTVLLQDAAVLIDTVAPKATDEAKQIVSCRMVLRTVDTGEGVPIGATQGTQSALGYSQSWTVGTGGAAGELYLSRADRRLLGLGNAIGSYSPVEELAGAEEQVVTL